jgi:hypothetical protein
MKIIKEKSREYKGQPYYKFRINLPWKLVQGAGFKEGDDLEGEHIHGQITLKKKEKDQKEG